MNSTYELAYNYTDEAGNEADTVIRTVHVINLAPHDLVLLSDSTSVSTRMNQVVLGLQI